MSVQRKILLIKTCILETSEYVMSNYHNETFLIVTYGWKIFMYVLKTFTLADNKYFGCELHIIHHLKRIILNTVFVYIHAEKNILFSNIFSVITIKGLHTTQADEKPHLFLNFAAKDIQTCYGIADKKYPEKTSPSSTKSGFFLRLSSI